MTGFDGYDQWKTASPYDDEPDIIEECQRVAGECEQYIKAHKELSDLTHAEEVLLNNCMDTLKEAARFIDEEL